MPQGIPQMVHHGLDAGRTTGSRQVDGIDVDRGDGVVREDGYQFAAAQLVADQEGGQGVDTKSIDGSKATHVATVGADAALDRYLIFASVAFKFPDIEIGRVAVSEAVVLPQVVRVVGRAIVFEIGRRGAAHHAYRRQFTGDQAGLEIAGNAHRHVDSFFHQIHDPVRKTQLQVQVGIAFTEFGDRGCDVPNAETGRQADAQHTARLAFGGGGLGFCFFDIGEDGAAAVVIIGTDFGQVEPARRALQQLRPEMLLQFRDMARCRCCGKMQLLGRAGERADFNHGRKDPHCLKSVHRAFLPVNCPEKWDKQFMNLIFIPV